MSSIVLGGGCFWCLEAVYQQVDGIKAVTSGYAGGDVTNPSYDQVCSGQTGHAEVVKLDFDENNIDLRQILDIFWTIHDPTTLNQQGADIGTQYRSIILFNDRSQCPTIEESLDNARKIHQAPIVTEVDQLKHFYPAEKEHRNFFRNNPYAGYCQVIIQPKLDKLQAFHAKALKQ